MGVVYIRVVSNPPACHETRELVPGCVMADFDEAGNLLGVEVLVAVAIVVPDKPKFDVIGNVIHVSNLVRKDGGK